MAYPFILVIILVVETDLQHVIKQANTARSDFAFSIKLLMLKVNRVTLASGVSVFL